MTSEADDSESTGSNLTERGASIADEHGMSDPLLALALQEILDAADADPDTHMLRRSTSRRTRPQILMRT